MAPVEGFVIAIHGAWGTGKSTMLNFVKHYLLEQPQTERPTIIEFNPWWFSGKETLLRAFFDRFQAELMNKKLIGPEVVKVMLKLANKVSESDLPIPWWGKLLAMSPDFLVKRLHLIPETVPELKNKIVKTLSNPRRRILVMMDDVDRLADDEIRQLFSLMKAVADFPNTTYLLAFDRDIAAKALSTKYTSGEEYLEKIVQVPFELPLPTEGALARLLNGKLEMILEGTPSLLLDADRWAVILRDGLKDFINTPRDVVRLINALRVTYPPVKQEVNAVDFIALEVLRLFCPIAYQVVRYNPQYFTGSPEFIIRRLSATGTSGLKSFHEGWIGGLNQGDRESVKAVLMWLFPKLRAVWAPTAAMSRDEHYEQRRRYRICFADMFPIYFRQALPEGRPSDADIHTLLSLADDPMAFGSRLVQLANEHLSDGTTRVKGYLDRFVDLAPNDWPRDDGPLIVKALFDVGDELLRPEDVEMSWRTGNDLRMARILANLQTGYNADYRFEMLKSAISEGKALSVMLMQIQSLGMRSQGKGRRK